MVLLILEYLYGSLRILVHRELNRVPKFRYFQYWASPTICTTGLLQDNMEPTLTRAWHFHSKVDQNLTAQIDSEGPRGPRVDWCEKKSRLGLGAGNKVFFNFLLRVSQQSAHEAQAQPGSNEVRHAWSKLVPQVSCPARAA